MSFYFDIVIKKLILKHEYLLLHKIITKGFSIVYYFRMKIISSMFGILLK